MQHIHQSRDPALFQNLLQAYEQLVPPEGVSLPNAMDLAQLDVAWADETIQRNQADRAKLEVELKTYSNNMIKESIRVSGVLYECGVVDADEDGWLVGVDGASRSWGLLSVDGRFGHGAEALYEVARVLHDEPACARDVHVDPRGVFVSAL